LKVVGVAGLLTGLGFGLLPYSWSLIAVLGTVVVWTFGEMLSFPLTAAWAANRAGARNRGRYMGAQAMVFSVGVVVAPLAGTATYERLGPDVLWHACLVLGALNLAGYLWLARRLQASGSTDPTPVS
jgi:MFS family permease